MQPKPEARTVFSLWPVRRSPSLPSVPPKCTLPVSPEAIALSPTVVSPPRGSPFGPGALARPVGGAITPASIPSLKAAPLAPTAAMPGTPTTSDQTPPPSQVGAHLPFFISQWEEISSSPSVLCLVRGVSLEFNAQPPLIHAHRAADSARGLPPHKQILLRMEVKPLLAK